MYGIASGLNYLHNEKIIHGKINPKSILINEKMEPIITNFDQSQKAKNKQIHQSIMFDETIYTAPELLKMENDENISLYRAKASDVYNFSLIIYHIFTGERPWNNLKHTMFLPSKIINGERPNFPPDFPKIILLLIKACWDQDPNSIPSFSIICDIISNERFLNYLSQDNQKIDLERFKEYQSKVLKNDLNYYQNDICINEVLFPKIPNDKFFFSSRFQFLRKRK